MRVVGWEEWNKLCSRIKLCFGASLCSFAMLVFGISNRAGVLEYLYALGWTLPASRLCIFPHET